MVRERCRRWKRRLLCACRGRRRGQIFVSCQVSFLLFWADDVGVVLHWLCKLLWWVSFRSLGRLRLGLALCLGCDDLLALFQLRMREVIRGVYYGQTCRRHCAHPYQRIPEGSLEKSTFDQIGPCYSRRLVHC